jgi:hypothetical protein
MYRKFITTIAAASVALTALGATPAFADRDDDLARALAAILGVAVIGSIIHDNKKKKKARHVPRQEYQPVPKKPHVYRPHVQPRVQPHVDPKPLPRHVRRKLLPQHCLRSFDTRQGRVRMFPRRCLESNYSFINRLPAHCATRIKTDRGRRVGWEARCLRHEGYRLARR